MKKDFKDAIASDNLKSTNYIMINLQFYKIFANIFRNQICLN